jgi:hypothetical protein
MKLYDVNFFFLSQRKPKRNQPEVSNANVNGQSNQSSQVPQVLNPEAAKRKVNLLLLPFYNIFMFRT